ncbi:MAG: HigA family addiction module antitoxin [Chloroflexota bacterium]|nr:MAG: transcriptional regulator [Bellilinea sp.]
MAESLIIHPGEVLLEEYMKPLGISQNALARQLRVPPDRINAIVGKKRGISADTALRLAVAFGTTPEFWINLQAHYDLEYARSKLHNKIIKEVLPIYNIPD